jgi:hypothetical protein
MFFKALKFPTIILTLALGVSVLTTGCSKRGTSHPSLSTTNTQPSSTLPIARVSTSRSGKVLVRFKEFEFGKDWSADFEITNETNAPISYIGDKTYRFAYCTLGAKLEKQNIAFTIRDFCTLGNFVSLQTLEPGQSMVLAAQKNEVHDLLYKNDLSSTVTAQIGFEIFVGNDRHRETVWSEQITFPNQEPR